MARRNSRPIFLSLSTFGMFQSLLPVDTNIYIFFSFIYNIITGPCRD
nr:MAG TPA: hypothetical protein [Caudoviricetes sp.]